MAGFSHVFATLYELDRLDLRCSRSGVIYDTDPNLICFRQKYDDWQYKVNIGSTATMGRNLACRNLAFHNE